MSWIVAQQNPDQIKEYDAEIVSGKFDLRSSALKYMQKLKELEGGKYMLIYESN